MMPNFHAPVLPKAAPALGPALALDTTKPPPFKIPYKPAPSAVAGDLEDLLATNVKTSGFTIPMDPPTGLPHSGRAAPASVKAPAMEQVKEPAPGVTEIILI